MKSMILCVWQVMRRDGLKALEVDFQVLCWIRRSLIGEGGCVCHFATPAAVASCPPKPQRRWLPKAAPAVNVAKLRVVPKHAIIGFSFPLGLRSIVAACSPKVPAVSQNDGYLLATSQKVQFSNANTDGLLTLHWPGAAGYLLIMKFLTKTPDGLSRSSVQGPVALPPG